MAVQHHLDQPLMHVKELDIAPGFETQRLCLVIQKMRKKIEKGVPS